MLYKYLSAERIDVLENLKIRFSQPIVLNDPFESFPKINHSVLEGRSKFLSLYIDTEECWGSSFDFKKNEALREEIKQERKTKGKSDVLLHHTESDLQNNLSSSLGILSLSRNPSNLLMWSHYADNHGGIVIGINTEKFCAFLNQTNPRIGYGNTIKKTNAIPVQYTAMRGAIFSNLEVNIEDALYEKSIDWSYEEEVRIIISLPENKNDDPNGKDITIHLHELPKDVIEQVFLGANIKDRDIDRVNYAKKKHNLKADFFSLFLSKKEYRLIPKPYKE